MTECRVGPKAVALETTLLLHGVPREEALGLASSLFEIVESEGAEPALVDEAMRQRVVIASPMSLMALLLTIARGWQTTQLAENAKKVEEHGRELHHRVGTTLTAMAKTGRGLESATKAYNEMVGSVESRVLPTLRRFSELGVSNDELPEVRPVESAARTITANELEASPNAEDPDISEAN